MTYYRYTIDTRHVWPWDWDPTAHPLTNSRALHLGAQVPLLAFLSRPKAPPLCMHMHAAGNGLVFDALVEDAAAPSLLPQPRRLLPPIITTISTIRPLLSYPFGRPRLSSEPSASSTSPSSS